MSAGKVTDLMKLMKDHALVSKIVVCHETPSHYTVLTLQISMSVPTPMAAVIITAPTSLVPMCASVEMALHSRSTISVVMVRMPSSMTLQYTVTFSKKIFTTAIMSPTRC